MFAHTLVSECSIFFFQEAVELLLSKKNPHYDRTKNSDKCKRIQTSNTVAKISKCIKAYSQLKGSRNTLRIVSLQL